MKTSIKISMIALAFIFLSSFTLIKDSHLIETKSEIENTVAPNFYYDVICITNTLDFTVVYSIKWGNGPWKTICLERNSSYRHWYCLTNNNQYSPNVTIEFDYTVNDNRQFKKTYNLNKYASYDTSCEYARKYVFEYIEGTRYRSVPCIDIFRE